MALQEVLGERLGTLQARGVATGPETAQSLRFKGVDDSLDEGRLGPDNRQVHRTLRSKRDQRSDIRGTDGYVLHARFHGRASIARRDEDVIHTRRLRRLPRQRMLAATAANDQYLHVFGHS